MGKPLCPLCQGVTTPCYLVLGAGGAGYIHQCHGMEKNLIGASVRGSDITARVCVECGYIMAFANDPAPFKEEVDQTY